MRQFWFKSKKFGYGWTPATWQGWIVIAVYLNIVVGVSLVNQSPRDMGIQFALATLALIVVVIRTGEKPRWRWGKIHNRRS